MVRKSELSVGDKVYALFRKYGKRYFIGNIVEISENEHGLDGVWVSVDVLKTIQGEPLLYHHLIVPISDILGKVGKE